MTDQEYRDAQDALMLLGEVAERFKWSEFIERISKAESVESILYPALFPSVSSRLGHIKQMATDTIRIAGSYHNLKSVVNDEIHSHEREE